MEEYRYRIRSTGGSSARYGNCEVCSKPVTEVFHQVEERKFKAEYVGGWTYHKCHNLLGHEKCLLGKRR